MIKYCSNDIFDSNTEAIVNTVNCVGIMGAGLALQYKKRYPENYVYYKKICDLGLLTPGGVLVYDTCRYSPKYIFNVATKEHWKDKSTIPAVTLATTNILSQVKHWGISSITIPPMGAGLGGLSREIVEDILVNTFEGIIGLDVYIYKT